MGHFIVERFVPEATAADVKAWAETLDASIHALKVAGDISYLGSEFVNRDETCLCFFDASSEDLIRLVNDHAGVPYERVLACEAVRKPAEKSPTT